MPAGRSSSYADRVGRQYEQQFGRPASADDPQYASYVRTALPQMAAADQAALEKSKGRWKTADKFAWGAVASPFVAAAAPAVLGAFSGGGAASGAAGSAAGASAPAVGAGMTFGNMLKLGELGVGAATNILGQRSQNRALNQQQAIDQRNYGEQMQLAREQEAYRRSEADRVAKQEEARWQTEEAYRQKQVAADEEERAYSRRLMDEREARRAPKRAAGQAALLRLQDLLRLGGR